MEKIIVNSSELASLFDLPIRQIQRFTLDGVISPVTNDRPYRYDLEVVCPQYIAYLDAKIIARAKTHAIEELEERKLRAEAEIKEAKAAVAKLERDELEGKMHRAEDVEAITTDHVLFLRSMLMAMPGKLAVDLGGTHTAAEQAERVKQEVYFILDQLANYKYDPEEYKKRVMERQGWEHGGKDDADG